jgi:hypothetical protein
MVLFLESYAGFLVTSDQPAWLASVAASMPPLDLTTSVLAPDFALWGAARFLMR